MWAMRRDEPAGILQLDLERDAAQGVGYIPFFYMMPQLRCQGLGVQLLGQAVSAFRPLGRTRLRLRCAPENGVAQRFGKRTFCRGFEQQQKFQSQARDLRGVFRIFRF